MERSKSTESQMKELFLRFLKDESGVTAIEYGLLAGLISVTIIASATAVGVSVNDVFNQVATSLGAV